MRPSSFAENGFGFGEPELDANTALTELDKGLRSSKIGEQCEAIVRFPALFERYPFPILINSAFLKLADVFRTGSNFLRLWVLRVCQQSERHLEKILNVDEFIRRIFSVIHSNDPIARALTLRTLGSLAGLIPERKPVHHSIRVALDSHDRVEVSAAIYAASCFAKRSKTFGTTMCTKISSMVQRLSTPIDLKLRLIPIFQHMHHDVATASMVRTLCQELLVNYPSEEFVTTTLHTLTQLAASTISDLTQQVAFLLANLGDSRSNVKLSVLKDLKFLGQKGGHLWDSGHISILIDCALSHCSEKLDTDIEYEPLHIEIVHTTLDVINSVTSSSAILTFIYSADSQLWKLLETSIQSSDMTIALKAIQIATYIAVNWKNERLSTSGLNLVEMATDGVESLLKTLCAQITTVKDEVTQEESLRDLEKCLYYGVLLCKAKPSKCDWFCGTMVYLLGLVKLTARSRYIICQSIGSVGSFSQEAIQKIMPDIWSTLAKWHKKQIGEENSTVVILIALIFQAHQGFSLSPKASKTVNDILVSSNLWLAYRIARNALRYGQPEISALALEGMSARVSSENYHFWLSSLFSVATAENILANSEKTPKLTARLNEATNLYIQAVASLKAASSPLMSLQFQIEYVRIRSEMLVSFSNFLVSCGTLQFSPPPAIAGAMAAASRDELLKCGRVVTQMRKSIREFQAISDMYGRLYQTAFDADSDTLLNIQILKQMCLFIARAIEKQVVSKDHPSFSDDDQALNFCLEMNYVEASNSWSLIQSCKLAVQVLQGMKTLPVQVLNYQHLDCLKEVVRILVETPVSYPRFFFQTLQMTRVKIAVSPQPRVPGESVAVMMGNNLALKVEGVIQQSGIQGAAKTSNALHLFRKPKAIRITVVSTPSANPRTHAMDLNKVNIDPVTLVKDVIPHRDFFTAQFLLAVCGGGLTSVTVDTSLVDYEGRLWMTGPRATLSVRVYEEPGASGGKGNLPASTAGSSRQVNPGMMSIAAGNPTMMTNRF